MKIIFENGNILYVGEPKDKLRGLWICYKCGHDSSDRKLVSVHAPGTWFICDECIEKEEKATGKVAVLSYEKGLMFMSKEEAERLTGKQL